MKVDFKSERTLGLIGSILILVGGVGGVIPYVGFTTGSLSLVGGILVLIALKGMGDKLGDDRPFRYYLYSILVAFGGVILAVIFLLVGFFSFSSAEMAFENEFHNSLGYMGITMIVVGLFVIFVVLILGVYFAIKAWRATYELTGVEEFDKVATWNKWGVITLIILIGFLFLLIAEIYQIIAFANLPESIEREKSSVERLF